MVANNNNTDCANTCRLFAIILGLLGFAVFFWMADYRFISSLLLAALVGIASWFILKWLLCKDEVNSVGTSSSQSSALSSAPESAKASTSAEAATDTEAKTSTSDKSVAAEAAVTSVASVKSSEAVNVKPSTALAGEQELAERKGEWKYEAPKVEEAPSASVASATPSKAVSVTPSAALAGEQELAERKGDWKYEAPVAEEAPAKSKAPKTKAATKKADTPKGKPTAKKTEAPKTKSAAKPKVADAKPASLLSEARPEGKDDLKLISGVGPKLEQTLNDLGVYHFDQVAKWKKKDIAWVDGNLRFKGRIERDDWMSQAKILAKGGETEFSKKKKKT